MRSLTRAGWALATGAVALFCAGRLLGLAELYVLGGVAAAAVVYALVLVNRPPASLRVERRLRPRRVHLGDQCRVEIAMTNTGTRRTPVLTLIDPVAGTGGALMVLAPLEPGERRSAGYRLPTDRRGVTRVGPLDAIRTDPFGLASRHHVVEGEVDLTVLPAIEPIPGRIPGGGHDDPLAGDARPIAGRSGDEEFASLRPYVVGDDLRRIHWPTTARTGQLSVRQDDPPWQGHVTILLDARDDRIGADDFEVAVSAAASILNEVALRGDRTRLIITDGTDTGPADARTARDLLLEHLAVVQRHRGGELPEPPSSDGRSSAGELVFITGSVDTDEVAKLSRLRHRYADTHVVVVGHGAATAPTGSGLRTVVLEPGLPFAAAWAPTGQAVGSPR
jgi:uncharacterized protein (DUF58 family)